MKMGFNNVVLIEYNRSMGYFEDFTKDEKEKRRKLSPYEQYLKGFQLKIYMEDYEGVDGWCGEYDICYKDSNSLSEHIKDFRAYIMQDGVLVGIMIIDKDDKERKIFAGGIISDEREREYSWGTSIFNVRWTSKFVVLWKKRF